MDFFKINKVHLLLVKVRKVIVFFSMMTKLLIHIMLVHLETNTHVSLKKVCLVNPGHVPYFISNCRNHTGSKPTNIWLPIVQTG